MTNLISNGHVWRVKLEERDTLKDMAAVSGYTMERLAVKIENIISDSIREEDERLEEELKGKEAILIPSNCPTWHGKSDACNNCKKYEKCPWDENVGVREE